MRKENGKMYLFSYVSFDSMTSLADNNKASERNDKQTEGHTEGKTHKERQTDRQTGSHTDRQPDSQTDRQTDRRTDSQTDKQIVRHTEVDKYNSLASTELDSEEDSETGWKASG